MGVGGNNNGRVNIRDVMESVTRGCKSRTKQEE